MSSKHTFPYEPDVVTPPGEMLQEVLEERGMTQAELAGRLGRTRKTVNEIVKAKAPLLPETALQLERVLGIPARFWSNAEANYRQSIARQKENERLADQSCRLQELPVKQLIQANWVPRHADAVAQLRAVLQFFGVASLEALTRMHNERCVAFRQSKAHPANSYAVMAWLRTGELQAQQIPCAAFDAKAFRRALADIRRLCRHSVPKVAAEMQRLCAASGVALVYVPEITGCRAWGVTHWVSPEKAILQLSLRGKSDDHFWFTFFHEAAHILLHPRKDTFLERQGERDKREKEADRFATEILVPPPAWAPVAHARPRSALAMQTWAERLNLAPGILVGRLQHEKMLPFTYLNGLKIKLHFAD